MTPLIAARTLGVAQTGLAIAALALLGCSTSDSTSEQVASLAVAAPAGEYCATDASSHVLSLKGANGNALRLAYAPGYGWKYLPSPTSGASRASDPFPRKVKLSPVGTALAETTAVPNTDPMAVFIDGPTGYTFAWRADTGWAFVGHISDSPH